jgi:peptidoglycan-associated lipoprotein
MRFVTRYFLLLVVPSLMTVGLGAQSTKSDHREVDLAVTYTEQYSNLVSTPTFWQQGGSVELSTQTFHGFGAAANFTGTAKKDAANSGVGLDMVTTTFGPRYTWHKAAGTSHGLAIFGQGLIGESHGFNSYFPSASGAQTDYNSFALQLGGGIDIGLSRHLAVRAIQADWLRTQFPNSTTNVQNSLRLGAGIVLRMR